MRVSFFATMGGQIAMIAASAFSILPAIPASAQTGHLHAVPAAAVSSAGPNLPNGTKIIARVPLNGEPVTRMYTQWENGRTYLYIEHGRQSLTAVNISKKKMPQIVDHAPGQIVAAQYEPLFEGGSIEVTPASEVVAGVDNNGGSGLRSTLENGDTDDARLLRAVGPAYGNLADREHRLVFFASPAQLLVVQDNRITAADFMTN